jgi:hypothetical protein
VLLELLDKATQAVMVVRFPMAAVVVAVAQVPLVQMAFQDHQVLVGPEA